jgi:hypothetical protein
MSRIKEQFIDEINRVNEDYDYQYTEWLKQQEDKAIVDFYEENKERFECEKIFALTNTYPF